MPWFKSFFPFTQCSHLQFSGCKRYVGDVTAARGSKAIEFQQLASEAGGV